MTIFWTATLLFLITFMLNFPMTRKPLSEDDGNWFYPAVFRNNGVKMYKNYLWCYGYFNIHWFTSIAYNFFKPNNYAFFYYLKIIWYSLTSVSIYWMTYCFWNNNSLSFISGLIFAIVVATPNTLFMLTYGEHFFILPINLSIISAYYGISTGNSFFLVLAGLTSAWAFQIKPTALLFCLCLPCSFYLCPNYLIVTGIFSFAFIFLNFIPILILRKRAGRKNQYFGHIRYIKSLIGPIITLLKIVLDRWEIRVFNTFMDKLLIYLRFNVSDRKTITTGSYIGKHHENNINTQMASFKRFMMPSIKDLRLIIVLAAIQITVLFIKFDMFCFLMLLLLILFLLMQQGQKNYYTPHFNPCWLPVSVLAAKTVFDFWPYLFKEGYLRYAMVIMILFMVFELYRIINIIYKPFYRSESNTFGFMGWELGVVYRLAETAGKYIREHSEEDEKLFVWGDMPSIYLHAKREIFRTEYMFIYAHQENISKEKTFLYHLRTEPPEFLIFFNFKIDDGWNIERLQNAIGIPYVLIETFKITAHGKTIKTLEGISLEFPLYRRNDNLYKEILLDKALLANQCGLIYCVRKILNDILEIVPGDFEASTRLALLKQNIVESKTVQSYLDEKLAENHDSTENAILRRLLAETNIDGGNLDNAVRNYEKALDSNPNDFRVYNGLGELSFSMDRIDDAFEYFKKAIVLHPYSSDVLNNIGVLLSQSGKRDDAIRYFQKALSFMPLHPDARKNMEALT